MALADLSILIAEDNEMNRWLLTEQLQYWCDNITQACNGGEAWELIQKHRYSLLFIDVNMPILSGYDLIKKARAGGMNQSAPMIAITAHVQTQQRHLLLAEGFNDCLIKPIVLADLQRVVSQWCVTANGNGHNHDYYANAILEKVEHNSELGRVFVQKLFNETPSQIDNLAQTIENRQCQQAWEIAHKLHGTFCFYGFEDFRALARSLEQYLLEADLAKATHQFQLLSAKFSDLVNLKAELLHRLEAAHH